MADPYRFFWAQWGILKLKSLRAILQLFGSFERAWKKTMPEHLRHLNLREDTIKRAFEQRDSQTFQNAISIADELNIQLLFVDDENYPHLLKQLDTAPPFLFVRGRLPSFHKSMAIVGTRAATDYGRRITQKLTTDLVHEGFVIVSGLALGIDAAAHRATLQSKGITVAVLGSGVDQIYPRSHHRLASEMLESGGALVSTYPIGTLPETYHFPQRNEIVAGLTRGTLVIEGGIKSGALITAKLALEQGREVFAVPGNVTQLGLSGTNHLIRNGEAKLIENVDHLIDDLGFKTSEKKPQAHDFNSDERKILESLSTQAKNVDQLFACTEFDIPQLSEHLLNLQLKGAIAQQGERWVLV